MGERRKNPLQSLNYKPELPEITKKHFNLLHFILASQIPSTIQFHLHRKPPIQHWNYENCKLYTAIEKWFSDLPNGPHTAATLVLEIAMCFSCSGHWFDVVG
jgi:hypothetical protein